MAERIVSPGVFTREIDQSFLPGAVAQLGAAIVGPTQKGPAYEPTQVTSMLEYENIFGTFTDDSYVPVAVADYLRNGNVITVTRIMNEDGYTLTDSALALVAQSGSVKYVTHVLHPTTPVTVASDFAESVLNTDTNGRFELKISGSYNTVAIPGFTSFDYQNGASISASLVQSDSNYIGKILPKTPRGTTHPLYIQYENAAAMSLFGAASAVSVSLEIIPTYAYAKSYQTAATPWITSQKIGSVTKDLFRLHSLSAGDSTNYDLKVAISNIKSSTEVIDPDGYPTFTVSLRRVDTANILNSKLPGNVNDTDAAPNEVLVFDNVNLNPASSRYIAKVIGDRYQTIDSDGNISIYGDYANTNRFVRVEVTNDIATRSADKTLFPLGFRAPVSPIANVSGSVNLAPVSYVTTQLISNAFNTSVHFGFDFTNAANLNYLSVTPSSASTVANNTDFYLGDVSQSISAGFPSLSAPYTGSVQAAIVAGTFGNSIATSTRKFIVPMQGGFDGSRPNLPRFSGANITSANTFGFDCSGATTAGTTAYKKAFTLLSNTDYYDFNLLLTPGVIDSEHFNVTTTARNLCSTRQDVFYIMDSNLKDASIASVVAQTRTIDNNYTATYWPWLSINNPSGTGLLWVPPSVVVGGVIAENDRLGGPWYAPAGLTRGIASAVGTATNLSQTQRNTLYEARVNPIATFPNSVIVIWGQKTLQARPSALDRVNVRRLLIEVKKFIAASTRFLVFEQNTRDTRQRFLSIVEPYLAGVQQNQGLSAFRVVMDETNNTPDLIDRNILYGQLFLQPTRTAEFIVLDFNIQSTGAAFPE